MGSAMDPDRDRRDLKVRNRRTVAYLGAAFLFMCGLTAASVPLYRLFCEVTGFGGTTQVAETLADRVLDREIRVSFLASVDPGLPWAFEAVDREVTVKVGEPALIYYRARNTASEPTAGQAVYNVNPDKVGLYFAKVQCFCFDEQIIEPGEIVEFPVYFYIDPLIAEDRNLDDVRAVTLSYTFYPRASEALDEAIQAYYRSVETSEGPAESSPAAPPQGNKTSTKAAKP